MNETEKKKKRKEQVLKCPLDSFWPWVPDEQFENLGLPTMLLGSFFFLYG